MNTLYSVWQNICFELLHCWIIWLRLSVIVLSQKIARMASLALLQIFGCALKYYLTTLVAGFGPKVDNPIGTLYHLHVMLHNYYGVAIGYQRVECLKQTVYIMEMKTRCRLIENEHYLFGIVVFGKERCEFDTLALTSRKGG